MRQVERRSSPRVETDVPLRLTFKDSTVETRIRDLSTPGIRFRSPSALPLLCRVQIALELPSRGGAKLAVPIAINGVVVRCDERQGRDFDTAIYFEDLSSQARLQLSQFVSGRLP
jgi:hypothetical protein